MDPDLIDRIYESAFTPELWPGVLDDIAQIAGARGGQLFLHRDGPPRWKASERLHEDTITYFAEGWFATCPRAARLMGARQAGFLNDRALFTDDELAADRTRRDFLRPRGLGWSAGTALIFPTGDQAAVCVHRDHARGPFEADVIGQLDELRPHLARSVLLAARMQLERARAASETFALIGLPAVVLDDAGKVLAANDLIQSLPNHLRWRARDRVALVDEAADLLLRNALATLNSDDAPTTRSIAVRGAENDAPMVAHVVPIRKSARDIFVRCAAMVVLTPVTAPQAPPVELVQSLFDLTPAEARVARGLAVGRTVEEIAAERAVSSNTIRTHVRGVLEKTGCNRQAEVVALLSSVSPQGCSTLCALV